MLKAIHRFIVLSILSILLIGCSSSISIKEYFPLAEDNRDYTSMYLRGVFNWWEAEPQYRLMSSDGDFIVEVELIADGQPYDFKVADALYSTEHNCGSEASTGILSVDKKFTMTCNETVFNLQFTPSETAIYRFIITPGTSPSITVTKT